MPGSGLTRLLDGRGICREKSDCQTATRGADSLNCCSWSHLSKLHEGRGRRDWAAARWWLLSPCTVSDLCLLLDDQRRQIESAEGWTSGVILMPGAAALEFEGDLVPTFDHPANTTAPAPFPSRHHILITLHGSLSIEVGNRGIDRLNYHNSLRRSGRLEPLAVSLLHHHHHHHLHLRSPGTSGPTTLQQHKYLPPPSLSLAIKAVSCKQGLK